MARYAAVLDSCALVPIVLADTLLRVAERGLYRPLWSEARAMADQAQGFTRRQECERPVLGGANARSVHRDLD